VPDKQRSTARWARFSGLTPATEHVTRARRLRPTSRPAAALV
jgi:hypothetical protein